MLLVDPSARPVIGHRGASAEAPENTLPSFLRAVSQGVDAVELDVHVTADDVPVVLHDPTLERTTDRVGRVAAMAWRVVREADAGARFSPDGGHSFPFRETGIRVPTLEEALGALPATLPLIVEIKAVAAQAAVRRTLERVGAVGRAIVASFERAALAAFSDPPFARAATRSDLLGLMWRTARGRHPGPVRFRAICPPNVYYGVRTPIPLIVRGARALGCPVHVWTVNETAEADRLWRAGVSGLISNVPARLLAHRARAEGA